MTRKRSPTPKRSLAATAQSLPAAIAAAREHLAAGRLAEAVAVADRSVQRWNDSAELWQILAAALRQGGNANDALIAMRCAATLAPTSAASWQSLGELLLELDQYADAVEAFSRLLALAPDARVSLSMGIALQGDKRYAEAVASYQKAMLELEHVAGYTLHLNLGVCWHQLGDYLAAARSAEAAVPHAPDAAAAAVAAQNAGLAWLDAGEPERAIDILRTNPRPLAASNWLYALNFQTPYDPLAVLAAHRAWGERTTAVLAAEGTPQAPETPARSRRRIGFVSQDFHHHAVAFFLRPLLAALDRSQFEIVLYSDVRFADAETEEFRHSADRWVSIVGASDDEVATFIRADAPDVLVDLGSHTGERPALLARRLAPLQVSWLGYANTTGLRSIDAVLSDELLDPPGLTDGHYVEAVVRLGACAYTYTPPAAPEVAPLPLLANGEIRFASFNRPQKLARPTIALWSRVLAALPAARLLMVGKGFDSESGRQRLLACFADFKVDPRRIEWRGAADFATYMEWHREVHVALDCQPWSGHTVTLHAAWMGVPTLCLEAGHHAGRLSAACMRLCGLDDFVVANEDAFVARALALAGDAARLGEVRASLRQRMLASPLSDHAGLAQRFGAALLALAKFPLSSSSS